MAEPADSDNPEFQWHTNPDATCCPFVLTRKITFKRLRGSSLRTISAFPWSKDSIGLLWEGCHEVPLDAWNGMITAYEDAVATAADSFVEICSVRKDRYVNFILPPVPEKNKPLPCDAVHLAWALSPSNPCQPLLVVTRLHTIYIIDVMTSKPYSCLIGHGGAITSVAVHPVHPHIFATTSRDFTTRIYDLRFPPHSEEDVQYNPPWSLASDQPSKAGPAYGLNMDAKEGTGMGRCVAVLTGGLMAQTGGHAAAVLGAAFHTSRPLIATCGLDRAVKIWALPPTLDPYRSRLTRIDKPIFSCISIHRARVLSINWLSEDLLLSHSAPVLLRTAESAENDETKSYRYAFEPGELILWQWLALKRFFPPGLTVYQQQLRPMSNDYWWDNSSFRILSRKIIPSPAGIPDSVTPHLHLYVLSPHRPVPAIIALLTFPGTTSTCLIRVPRVFEGNDVPAFPLDREPHVNGEGDQAVLQRDPKDLVAGWSINVEDRAIPKVNACEITLEGSMIIGVGTKGTMWVWTIT